MDKLLLSEVHTLESVVITVKFEHVLYSIFIEKIACPILFFGE
jgi:hypothetical protein